METQPRERERGREGQKLTLVIITEQSELLSHHLAFISDYEWSSITRGLAEVKDTRHKDTLLPSGKTAPKGIHLKDIA